MTLSETSGDLETNCGFPNQDEALGDQKDWYAAVLALKHEVTEAQSLALPLVWQWGDWSLE